MIMVDIAQEAFRSQNFRLASEIFEQIIRENGPAGHLLIKLGNSLALGGQVKEAFTAFIKAYRLDKSIEAKELVHLVNSLTKLTRLRMEAVTSGGKSLLVPDFAELVDEEPMLCGICLSTLLEPTTIYCGHTFCHKCVEKFTPNTCVYCGKNPEITSGFQQNVLLCKVVHKLFPHLHDVIRLKKLAHEQFSRERYEEAVRIYTTIIELSSNDHIAWSNRSYALAMLEKYEDALKDATMAVRLKPQWAKGYFRKGSAEELLGRQEEAALSYMKCLAIDSGAKQAQTNLTKIVHSLLTPKMVAEDPKHVSSSGSEPISQLMGASNNETDEDEVSLNSLTSLLDQQFQECDKALQFDGEARKVNPSVLTVDMFDCSLCYRLLHNPVTTPCGHVFCQHCLDRAMDHKTCCPQCRGDLAEYLAHRNKAVTISIQKMLSLWFPAQVKERKEVHEAELFKFPVSGNVAEIPIFVCTMAFPTVPCPLHVFEPRYRLMMRQVMESGVRQFGMCMSTGNEDNEFADYGTMLEINDLQFFDDGRSVVDTVGGRRFRVISKSTRDGYNVAKVEFVEDVKVEGESLVELQSLHDHIHQKVYSWFANLSKKTRDGLKMQFGDFPEKEADVQAVRLGPKWVWWVMAVLPVDPRAQLSMLTMNRLSERLVTIDKVVSYLQKRQ